MKGTWLASVAGLILILGIATNIDAQDQGVEQQPIASPIDLERDDDADGIADDFAAALDRIELSPDGDAAIKEFLGRLPYSAHTRELQAEARRLQAQLAQNPHKAEAQAIVAQLQDLADAMWSDPNYSKTMEAMTTMLIPQSMRPQTMGVNWSQLTRGDVMLVRDPNGFLGWFTTFLYAMWYTHSGNYDGNSLVYESNADGVRLKPLSKWQYSGLYVGLARDNKRTVTEVQAALDWAKGVYSTDGQTPYNYFYPDKWTDNALYCSQLCWKIHDHLGVDLDSNHSRYKSWIGAKWGWWAVWAVSNPAVAPDEMALDDDLTTYSRGWN